MKLDMDRAWKDAVGLFTRNRSLLAVLAGVFMFLPLVAVSLAIDGSATGQALKAAKTMHAMTAAVEAFYAEFWWAVVIMGAAQTVGTLAMLALLKQRGRPTVGEALGTAMRALLPYIAAQLILAAALVLGAGMIVALGAVIGSKIVATLCAGAVLTLGAYAFSRFALVAPVMAIEGTLNPIGALARSARLTRGNAGRLLTFFALILAAFMVVSMLATMVISLFFALFGAEAALFGVAMGSAAISAAFTTLVAALLASVHAQLLWKSAPDEPEAPTI